MATVLKLVYSSAQEGSNVWLSYDDVTLIGSGFRASIGANAKWPLAFHCTFATGNPLTGNIQLHSAITSINFPAPIQGVNSTDSKGDPFIDFGIVSYGIAFGAANAV